MVSGDKDLTSLRTGGAAGALAGRVPGPSSDRFALVRCFAIRTSGQHLLQGSGSKSGSNRAGRGLSAELQQRNRWPLQPHPTTSTRTRRGHASGIPGEGCLTGRPARCRVGRSPGPSGSLSAGCRALSRRCLLGDRRAERNHRHEQGPPTTALASSSRPARAGRTSASIGGGRDHQLVARHGPAAPAGGGRVQRRRSDREQRDQECSRRRQSRHSSRR